MMAQMDTNSDWADMRFMSDRVATLNEPSRKESAYSWMGSIVKSNTPSNMDLLPPLEEYWASGYIKIGQYLRGVPNRRSMSDPTTMIIPHSNFEKAKNV
jgi:hypothetical protein